MSQYDTCATCGEELGWFEKQARYLYPEFGSVDCDECEEADAMKAAIARGEDELKASEEYRQQRSERIRAIDAYERGLDP